MKRLSVIIPGYNTPKEWWQRCVASVSAVIGVDDEIIVVDDGSKTPVDTSWFCDTVRLVRCVNGGLSRARNAGIEVAQGKYVTFVDSDDEVHPDVFKRCLVKLDETDADICFYGVKTCWTKEALLKYDRADDRNYGCLTACDVQDLSSRCLLNYAWNKVYRREFIDKHKLRFNPDGIPCEDIIFNLDCIVEGARWCSIDYVGYVYYRVTGGRSLLATYKPSNLEGIALGAKAWQRYIATLSVEDAAPFVQRGVLTELELLSCEWKNIWMPGTPYSILARWRWLREHPMLGGVKTFLRTFAYTFLRRYFYIRCVRRWHIRRMYPFAEELA